MSRVFSEEEQNTIQNASNKTKTFWAIWAAKEASYKACKKKFPDLVFAHRKFAVTKQTLRLLQNVNEGLKITGFLKYEELFVSLQWQWNVDAMHCIAVFLNDNTPFDNWVNIHWSIKNQFFCNKNQNIASFKPSLTRLELNSVFSEESLKTRLYAKQYLRSLGFDKNIEIIRPSYLKNKIKRFGPPALFIEKKRLENDISLSHDGNWIAVAVSKN